MNRAERRRQKIKTESPQITKPEKFMTEDEFIMIRNEYERRIKEMKAKVKDATKQIITDSLMSALLIELHYNWGFGGKRLDRLMSGVHIQLNLIHDKIIEHEELLDVANDIIDKYNLVV